MNTTVKEILRNIFSVVAGVIISLLIIIPVGIFAALLSFSDAAIPKSQEIFSTVLMISGIVAGCLSGGFVTARISTRFDLIHVIIAGIVLTYLYAHINDFEFNWQHADLGIAYFGFIPVVLIGGLIGMRKKANSNTDSSQPGTL